MGKLKLLNFKKEKTRLNYFIGYFWLMPVILSTFSGNLKLIVSGVNLFTVAIYAIFVFLLVLNFKNTFLKLTAFDIMYFVFLVLSISATMIIFPQNIEYINESLYSWVFAFLYYFIGKLIARTVSGEEILCNVSKYGIILSYIAYITAFGMTNKDMSFAYVVLAYVVMTANSGFNNEKLTDIYWSVAGIVLLFALGTRGPLLFGVLYILYRAFLKMGKGWKITVLSVFSITAALFVETKAYYSVLQSIDTFLQERSINSYIINQILTGNTASNDQRLRITERIIQAIQNQPLGYGLFGDRIVLNGSYSHNIILEILCSFGVALGVIVLILFGLFIYKAIRNSKYYNRTSLLVAFVFIYLMKYLLSNSIVSDMYFGLFMGLFSFFYADEGKKRKSLLKKQ